MAGIMARILSEDPHQARSKPFILRVQEVLTRDSAFREAPTLRFASQNALAFDKYVWFRSTPADGPADHFFGVTEAIKSCSVDPVQAQSRAA